MLNQGKNNMFLVYIFACMFLINIYSFSLESNIKSELNDYQKHLLRNLDSFTNEYFYMQEKYIYSFLSTHLEDKYIEDFNDDENGLIQELKEFEEYSKEMENSFIYYDDGKVVLSHPEVNLDIINNNIFIDAYNESKIYGKTVITNIIDDHIYIIRPLYTRNVTYRAVIVSSINVETIAKVYETFNDEKLIGGFVISQDDRIVYSTTDKNHNKLVFNEIINQENNITIYSNISYRQCEQLCKSYYTCKIIVRTICVTIIALSLIVLYSREKIKTKNKFKTRYNMLFLIIALVIEFTYTILITAFYIEFLNDITSMKVCKINQFVSESEQIEYEYNNAKFKMMVETINNDLENYKLEETHDVILNKYNKYIYKMMDLHENINGMMIVLQNSDYRIIPSITLKNQIIYKEEWTLTPYLDEDIYYLRSDKFENNYQNIILSPIKVNGHKVGIVGYSILRNYYTRRISNTLNIDNITVYLIDENKVYMVKNNNIVETNTKINYIGNEIFYNSEDKELYGIENYSIENEKSSCEYVDMKTLNSRVICKVNLNDTMKKTQRVLINIIMILIMFSITLLCTCSDYKFKAVKEGNKNE